MPKLQRPVSNRRPFAKRICCALLLLAAVGSASSMLLRREPESPPHSGFRGDQAALKSPLAELTSGYWTIAGMHFDLEVSDLPESELWRRIESVPPVNSPSAALDRESTALLRRLAQEVTATDHTTRYARTTDSLVMRAYCDRGSRTRLIVAYIAYPHSALRERWSLVRVSPQAKFDAAGDRGMAILPDHLKTRVLASRQDAAGNMHAAFVNCSAAELEDVARCWVSRGGVMEPSPCSSENRRAMICRSNEQCFQLIALPWEDHSFTLSIIDLRAGR